MLATAPASAVSIAAATGANKAAKGIRVGSVPVTITGSVMARIVATAQIPSVATDNPTPMGCQLAAPQPAHRPQQHQGADPAPKPGRERGHRKMFLLRAGDQIGRQQADQQHRDPDSADPDGGPQRGLSTLVRQVSQEIAEAAPVGRGAC
jgi:hypothetical protein